MNKEPSAADYAVLRKFLQDSSGIVLGDNKQYLVRSRLSGLLRETRYATLGELIAALRAGTLPAHLRVRIVDAMTTNETFWFREPSHFEELKTVLLPAWMGKREETLRIWSAACSTGQEPYSISLCIEEFFRTGFSGPRRPVDILGTDLSDAVLAEARRAVYGDLALSRGLDILLRNRYFAPDGDRWKLKPEVSSRVRFRKFNLLDAYAPLGTFDAIFCRNVLIYFADPVKRDILRRLARALKPGGFLFLGSAEVVPQDPENYDSVRGVRARYYRRKPGA